MEPAGVPGLAQRGGGGRPGEHFRRGGHRLGATASYPALYRSFFHYPDGPPQTAHELNRWGDDMVHEYLRGIEHRGCLGVLYSNKD